MEHLKAQWQRLDPRVRALAQVLAVFAALWVLSEALIQVGG